MRRVECSSDGLVQEKSYNGSEIRVTIYALKGTESVCWQSRVMNVWPWIVLGGFSAHECFWAFRHGVERCLLEERERDARRSEEERVVVW